MYFVSVDWIHVPLRTFDTILEKEPTSQSKEVFFSGISESLPLNRATLREFATDGSEFFPLRQALLIPQARVIFVGKEAAEYIPL